MNWLTPDQRHDLASAAVAGVGFLFTAAILGALFFAAIMASPARGHEHQQWIEEYTEEIAGWIKSLKQPDNPGMSCCGEADAYWADKIDVVGDQIFATVTDVRDDAPLKRRHVPPGTRVFVPNYKLKFDAGNPTGHNVIFLTAPSEETGDYQVYCFVQTTGI